MSEALNCSRCGQLLSASCLEGLCPVCVARVTLGLGSKRSAPGDGDSPNLEDHGVEKVKIKSTDRERKNGQNKSSDRVKRGKPPRQN
jgi:hypothetical protein